MVFIKRRQVIVAAPFNPYQGNFIRADGLQLFAVADGNEPVFGAMQNISMAVYMPYPFISTQMIAE